MQFKLQSNQNFFSLFYECYYDEDLKWKILYATFLSKFIILGQTLKWSHYLRGRFFYIFFSNLYFWHHIKSIFVKKTYWRWHFSYFGHFWPISEHCALCESTDFYPLDSWINVIEPFYILSFKKIDFGFTVVIKLLRIDLFKVNIFQENTQICICHQSAI